AKEGKLLWYYKRMPPYKDVLIPTPLVHGDEVFTTIGMGPRAGCDLVKISQANGKFTAAKVYANLDLANVLGGVVLVDGYVYGSPASKPNGWLCMDFEKGQVAWRETDALDEEGSNAAADGRLYCYGQETGTVVLLEPNPTKWTEKGRFIIPEKSKLRAPSGKIWTPPVIANGRLYLRDQDLLFCYNIKE